MEDPWLTMGRERRTDNERSCSIFIVYNINLMSCEHFLSETDSGCSQTLSSWNRHTAFGLIRPVSPRGPPTKTDRTRRFSLSNNPFRWNYFLQTPPWVENGIQVSESRSVFIVSEASCCSACRSGRENSTVSPGHVLATPWCVAGP